VCRITGCDRTSGVLLPIHHISNPYLPALFGEMTNDETSVMLCRPCFRRLRNKHGAEWGYRTRDGITERYVRDWWF
jgi:hypothetical protein